jgi:undecaprenyl-diphosphatase
MDFEATDLGAVHGIHNYAYFPWMKPGLVVLVYLGSRYVVPALALLAAVGLVARGLRRPALLLLLTVAAAFGLGYAAKVLVSRAGPNVEWRPLDPEDIKSFPSLNALTSAALFGALALLLARRTPPGRGRVGLLAVGFVLPFLVGVACLFAGHNYVTDVVGGWAAGAALALACAWADEATSPSFPPLPAGERGRG